MKEIQCPYCEYEFDLCHDDGAYYNESEPEDAECPECEKKFMVHSSFSWDFEAEQAECLNTGNHQWRKRYNERLFPQLQNKEECATCNEKRTLPLTPSPEE